MDISHLLYISNQAIHLPAMVTSLLNQMGDHSREIILVDDASSDASLAVMQQLAREDSRIRILGSDTAVGMAEALNAGAKLAQGTWLQLMPYPGILPINACHTLLSLLQEHSVNVISGYATAMDEPAENLIGKTMVHAPTCILTDHPLETWLGKPQAPDTIFCRAEVYARANGCDPKFTHVMEALSLRIATVALRWLRVEVPIILRSPDMKTPVKPKARTLWRERFFLYHALLQHKPHINEEQRRILYRRAMAALQAYRLYAEIDGTINDSSVAALPSLWHYLCSKLPFISPQLALLDTAARSLSDDAFPITTA